MSPPPPAHRSARPSGQAPTPGRALVGTSGWSYDNWRERFYPADLPKKRWFEYFAQHFATVELNATFYRLFPATTFGRWSENAPPGFVYATKLWRVVTHRKRLVEVQEELEVFLERASELGATQGPLLVQLPPNLRRDDDRLAAFLDVLADARAQRRGELRVTMEFRHASWNDPAVFERLGAADVGLCLVDTLHLQFPQVVTTDFTYVRFHGREESYATLYSREQLRPWAAWVRRELAAGHDVYAYFNNDYNAHAVQNARDLVALLAEEE